MSNFLSDLALAHQAHEGWCPPGSPGNPLGTLSFRNNNPGNLRLTAYEMQAFLATPGEGGFARFPNYQLGFQALEADVKAKITGHSTHIDYAKDPTFLDYVKVYAPTDDGNDPNGYCQALCRQLSRYGVRPDTPLTVLAALIDGPKEVVPPPPVPFVPPTPAELQAKLDLAEQATAAATPERKSQLRTFILSVKRALSRLPH